MVKNRKNIWFFCCIFFSVVSFKIFGQKDILVIKPEESSANVFFESEGLKDFEVNLKAVKDYFEAVNGDYILSNPDSSLVFMNALYQPVELDLEEIGFKVNNIDSTITTKKPLSPESIQNLFSLDEEAYIEKYGGNDFLSAKINNYHSLSFSLIDYRYSKRFYQFWDWKSLNHPPVKYLSKPLDFYEKSRIKIDYDTINSVFFSHKFHTYIDNVTGTHLTFNNQLELLENGLAFDKKMELIRDAKKSIFISVMSYYKDSSSKRMSEELVKKAKEGVHIILLVEKVWTKLLMKQGLRDLPKNNITIIYADDLLKYDQHEKALFHNKIWIFDNDIAIVGGQNIIDSDNISSGFNHQSRDTDLLVIGPAVTDISESFIKLIERYDYQKKCDANKIEYIENFKERIQERFLEESGQKLRGQDFYKEIMEDPSKRMKGVCRFVIQGPQTDKNLISKVYLHYLRQAQNLVDLNTGKISLDMSGELDQTFTEGWDQQLWTELIELSKNEVSINLISNGVDGGYGELSNFLKRKALLNPDNKFISKKYPRIAQRLDVKAAKRNYPYLKFLQEKENFNVWFYFQYMHSKTMFIDRIVVSVGSFNLDRWSADKSHESVIICQDKELSGQYEYNFVLDLVNSTPVKIVE